MESHVCGNVQPTWRSDSRTQPFPSGGRCYKRTCACNAALPPQSKLASPHVLDTTHLSAPPPTHPPPHTNTSLPPFNAHALSPPSHPQVATPTSNCTFLTFQRSDLLAIFGAYFRERLLAAEQFFHSQVAVFQALPKSHTLSVSWAGGWAVGRAV